MTDIDVIGARFIIPTVSDTVWTISGVSPEKAVIYFVGKDLLNVRTIPTVKLARMAEEGTLRFIRRKDPEAL